MLQFLGVELMERSMKQKPVVFTLAVLAIVTACSRSPGAISQNGPIQTASEDPIKALPIRTTIKPGAAIGFSHSELPVLQKGQDGRVTVFVTEPYDQGEMTISMSGSGGLDVFGAERSMRLDLSAGATHEVTINFGASEDGDYRIGISALVELDGGFRMGRAYAVPIRIGKGGNSGVARKGSIQTDLTGEQRVVFQAEETIR
ncbi:MAG: hypothetical protein AAGJ84_07515 [Pseudomonadota bacterium]